MSAQKNQQSAARNADPLTDLEKRKASAEIDRKHMEAMKRALDIEEAVEKNKRLKERQKKEEQERLRKLDAEIEAIRIIKEVNGYERGGKRRKTTRRLRKKNRTKRRR